METIIIQAEPKKKKALIEILKAFEVPFTVKKEQTYNTNFVEEVLKSRQDYKDGAYTSIKIEDLWK